VHVDLNRKDYPAARARFDEAFPELLAAAPPVIERGNYGEAVFLAAILLKTGEIERAKLLLERSEAVLQTIPRLGSTGFGVTDVMIQALRGDRAQALASLREAVEGGWRGPFMRIILELDPALAPIRREPEFKAIVAIIDADMARQRAGLAERRSDASNLHSTGD
jgi:hypothetical protein